MVSSGLLEGVAAAVAAGVIPVAAGEPARSMAQCLMELPDEIVAKCLWALDLASVARFSRTSGQASRLVMAATGLWAKLLAESLGRTDGEFERPAVPDPRAALRKWLQLDGWLWSHTKLALQPVADGADQPPLSPHRFLQRGAVVAVSPSGPHGGGGSPGSARDGRPGHLAVLFGGSSADPRADGGQYFNDTWRLSGARRQIVPVPFSSQHASQHAQVVPPARTAATLTAVGPGRLLLFGGHTFPGGFANDLWEGTLAIDPEVGADDDGCTVHWSFVGSGPDAEGQADVPWPPARQGHSATLQHGQVRRFVTIEQC